MKIFKNKKLFLFTSIISSSLAVFRQLPILRNHSHILPIPAFDTDDHKKSSEFQSEWNEIPPSSSAALITPSERITLDEKEFGNY